MDEKCCGGMSFVFVLEDSVWNAGLHLVDCFQHLFTAAGRFAALPREPSGGGKRQGRS